MSNFEKKITRGKSVDPALGVDAPASTQPMQTIGAPGTAVYGGYLVTREKSSELTGVKRYETFSEIVANTSVVAAGIRYFLNLVAKARWTVDPADDSPEAERLAELVEEIMNDMATPWHRVVRRAAAFVFYGYSIQEWTAKRREDGSIGMLDIEPRPQVTIEQWDLDEAGTVLGVIQDNPQNHQRIYIPREKCIYCVDDALNDSPEGLGLLRHLVKLAKRLERYELLEGWGFETDLRGMPIARGPWQELNLLVQQGQLTASQANQLKQPFLDFIDSHNVNPSLGMLLDSKTYASKDDAQSPSQIRQWDVELLQGSTTSAAEINAAIRRINREAARILGVEHMLLGDESGGSYSLSKDKSQSFGLIVDSCLKELKEVFEQDFLGTLWQLNGWDESMMPSFVIEQSQFRDLDVLGGLLETLSRSGAPIMPGDPAIDTLREMAGLPAAPEEDLLDPDMGLGGPLPEQPSQQDEESEELPEDDEQQVGKAMSTPMRGVESFEQFVERFMRNAEAMVEFPDESTRRAVAQFMWINR